MVNRRVSTYYLEDAQRVSKVIEDKLFIKIEQMAYQTGEEPTTILNALLRSKLTDMKILDEVTKCDVFCRIDGCDNEGYCNLDICEEHLREQSL